MAKSNSGTASQEKSIINDSNGESRRNGAPSKNGEAASLEPDYAHLMNQAKAWVEDNQTAAMLGGFGFGVFIGVLLRR